MNIKRIKASDTFEIRQKMLRMNIPLPYEFNGDHDSDTFHLGCFSDNQLIGVSSFMKASLEGLEGSQYQLRGMATLPEHQGKGVGKLLLQDAQRLLREAQIDYIWCNAREIAVAFYEKQGFEIVGQPFEVQHIGTHYKMIQKLK